LDNTEIRLYRNAINGYGEELTRVLQLVPDRPDGVETTRNIHISVTLVVCGASEGATEKPLALAIAPASVSKGSIRMIVRKIIKGKLQKVLEILSAR
jgi:hypothetical protein